MMVKALDWVFLQTMSYNSLELTLDDSVTSAMFVNTNTMTVLMSRMTRKLRWKIREVQLCK